MRRWKYWIALILMLGIFQGISLSAFAGKTIYQSPYVSFSPDGQAWTTNAGEKNCGYTEYGTIVSTGITSSLRKLQPGEHYYKKACVEQIPVGSWKVSHAPGTCIHAAYPPSGVSYHEISFGRQMCKRNYFSGWFPTCADCGEVIPIFFYMSRQAAESIDYLPGGSEYYYLCPFCNNLEQGRPINHNCTRISKNRYRVRYNPGRPGVLGHMTDDLFLYDNATMYEGEEMQPATCLSLNQYSLEGYLFDSWNTMPDGSGQSFSDGAEVLNLTTENWRKGGGDTGVVTLYAQWRAASGTLVLQLEGGSYRGQKNSYTVEGAYGQKEEIDASAVVPPAGSQVSFVTNGGSRVDPIVGTQRFYEWKMKQPFRGLFRNDCYYFRAPAGNVDTLEAVYRREPIELPATARQGYSFGGWYYDKEFRQPAGTAGDQITPMKNLTLYAQWVELVLTATDNYQANEGKGAVDLSWTQEDSAHKFFRLYQGKTAFDFSLLTQTGDQDGGEVFQEKWKPSDQTQRLEIPGTGVYHFEVCGAQGGAYGEKSGGKGGFVSADFWMTEGEVITVSVGASDGTGLGGARSDGGFGNGGGRTVVESDRQGLLLVGGGGGGAGLLEDGRPGGSDEGLRSDPSGAGESGMAGGGAGYRGGTAGEAVYHKHGEKCPYHAHSEGCYEKHEHNENCFRNYIEMTGATQINFLDCGCSIQHFYYSCRYCESSWTTTVYNSIPCVQKHFGNQCRNLGVRECHASVLVCDLSEEPFLTCPLSEGYPCGKEEGVSIDSAKPGYGGSNYVSSTALMVWANEAGVQSGDGTASVLAKRIGYRNDFSLNDVEAPDLEKPDGIDPDSVERTALRDRSVKLAWQQPADRGTTYYHKAESWLPMGEQPLCTSNVTENTLVSGIAGYLYVVNEEPFTKVTKQNGSFLAAAEYVDAFSQENCGKTRYLHVAAIDVAGNIGDSTPITLDYDGTEDEKETIHWLMETEKVQVAEGSHVYHTEDDRWFVRADGQTQLLLTAGGCLLGVPSEQYQPNHLLLEQVIGDGTGPRIGIYAGNTMISSQPIELKGAELQRVSWGEFPLEKSGYVQAKRTAGCRGIVYTQGFYVPESLHGEQVTLIPTAGADAREETVWSDREQDKRNGIVLVGDGEGPMIFGTESLEGTAIDSFLSGAKTAVLRAEDGLSGVREWKVTVYNPNNGCLAYFYPDADGRIRLRADSSHPLWDFDVVITVSAVDRVGNETMLEYRSDVLALEAELLRILEPHDPVFKAGESGRLTIRTFGYADSVTVAFPDALTAFRPDLTRTFDYSASREAIKTEETEFMIPLTTPPDGGYAVVVTARKGEKQVTKQLYFQVTEEGGSLLSELRTRLR